MKTTPSLAGLSAMALILALAAPAAALDGRFRLYGEGPVGGTDFPYRAAHADAGYAPGAALAADHLPVGALDGRSVGPYAGLDTVEVWKRWTFLRRRGWTLDAPLYEWVMRLIGARPGQLYAEDVLAAQIAAERPLLGRAIEAFVRARQAAGRQAAAEPIVFEVGNEPNVFPYMTPDLYAWYYLAWRREILAAVAAHNAGKPARDQVTAHLMPAGLWIFEGLPDAVLRTLDVTVSVATLRLVRRLETNTRRYYEQFLAAIRSERYAALGSGTYQTTYRSVWIPFMGTVRIARRTFVPAATQDLIDVAALHFYPYVGRHAAYGEGVLAPHLASLRDLSDLAAANARTGRVWLTELGNVSPFDDARTAREVLEPVLAHLKSGAIPSIDRWYWFKARGDDEKFRILGGLKGGAGGALSTVLAALDALRATGLVRVSHALTPADLRVLDELTDDYRRQTPVQGLLDAQGGLREVGRSWLRLAN